MSTGRWSGSSATPRPDAHGGRPDDWRAAPADHVTTRYEEKRLGDCAAGLPGLRRGSLAQTADLDRGSPS